MKKLMGLILSAALLIGLLAGCAGTPAENNSTSTPENTPAVSDTSTPEPTQTEEAAWPRTYVDATGKEIVIEKQPERIALSHFSLIESFYALGEAPIAAFVNDTIDKMSTLEPLRGTGIIELGESMDLELLLEVDPDLIIVHTDGNVKIREDLEKIAPVIQPNYPDGATTDDEFREYAKIIGKEEEAEKLIEDKYAKFANVREQLASVEDTVMTIGLNEKSVGIYGLFDNNLYGGDGLGINAPEGLTDVWWEQSSLEGLTVLNPDHIFIRAVTQELYDQGIASMSDSSVWNSLTAVKNGQVYRLDEASFQGGPLGALQFADLVLEKVAK